MDKVTGQCPQTTTFFERKESRSGIEPKPFRLPTYALPLGQTGSHVVVVDVVDDVAAIAAQHSSFFSLIFIIAQHVSLLSHMIS